MDTNSIITLHYSSLKLLLLHSYKQIQINLRWALFVTYTIIQSIMRSEMCSLHLTHPRAHTLGAVGSRHCLNQQNCPGSSWGFGALLKGLTSVVDTSWQRWDLNPQPWVTLGFKSNYPLGHDCPKHLYSIICASHTVLLAFGSICQI